MKVAVEPLEGCKHRLVVEAPLDVVQKEWERAYGRVQRQARLPGFRKGHVPRSLVKLHFADNVRREVAEHLIPDVYRQALSEARIDPVNDPDLQDVRLEENAPLSFVAVVEVKPQIDVQDYRGVQVQHNPPPLSDRDVEAAIDQLRDQQAEYRTVDRAAAVGDLVVVDYTLSPEAHEATTAAGYHFVVGAGGVLPEIDAAAVGMHVGEQREVTVRFGDDHRMESLRGKAGTARLKVTEVKEKVVPPLDDDFAKSAGPFADVEALRSEVRKRLEARRDVDARRALEDKIVDALLARHHFTVPETMVMRQVARQIELARENLRRQGLDPERVPWDYGKLLAELKPAAERAVRRALVLEAIADKEAIVPAEDAVDAEIDALAKASQRPAPAVRRMMEKSGDLEALRHGLREQKTLDLLVDAAKITA